MNEKKALFLITTLRNMANVYYETFLFFYIFKVANYEVLPLAKYYLTLYLFCAVGFFIIRKYIKNNVKVPYYRIGLSLQAFYVALIMILKENIINYIFLVGIVKGLAEGILYFPKNIMDTEKISNEERQKYNGLLNTVNKISSIVVPLVLGILLTYIDYVNLGKIFFVLFIIMFVLSFYLKDGVYTKNKKMDYKGFCKVVKDNKNVGLSLLIPFLSGLTYSAGVMGVIITLFKINIFKTNLNLGIVDSICALLFLLMCILFTFIKKEKISIISLITGTISFIILIIFAFIPSNSILILYLFMSNTIIGLLNLVSSMICSNIANIKEIKNNYKAEYYLIRDIIFSISRCIGYSLLLVVSINFEFVNISYILIICAISLLIEGFVVAKLSKENF